jgi:hypothetical protein
LTVDDHREPVLGHAEGTVDKDEPG